MDEIKTVILSRIVNTSRGNVLVGYVILDLVHGRRTKYTIDVLTEINKFKGAATAAVNCLNADWDRIYKTYIGRVVNLTEYPSVETTDTNIKYAAGKAMNVNLTGKLVNGGNGLTLTHHITDEAGKEIGAVVWDAFGKQLNLSTEKLLKLQSEQMSFTNFSLTSEGYVIPKDSAYPVGSVVKQIVGKTTAYNSSDNEVAPPVEHITGKANEIPFINVSSFDDVSKSEFASPAQDTMLKAIYNLKRVSPYYFSVFQAIKRTPLCGLGTMAASEDEIFYDVEFVSSHTVSEITFVLIHELQHILMRHSLRGRHKNHELWNIATDMFINETICHECGIQSLGDVKTINGGQIEAEKSGIYAFEYGISLDLAKTTPENIYMELLKENPQYGMGGNNSPQKKQRSIIEIMKDIMKESNSARATAKSVYSDAVKANDASAKTEAGVVNKAAKAIISSCRNEADFNKVVSDTRTNAGVIDNSGKTLEAGNTSKTRGSSLQRIGGRLNTLADELEQAIKQLNQQQGNSGQSGSNQQSPTQQLNNAINQIRQSMEDALNETGNSAQAQQATRGMEKGIQQLQNGIQNKDQKDILDGLNQMNKAAQDMQDALSKSQPNGGNQNQQGMNGSQNPSNSGSQNQSGMNSQNQSGTQTGNNGQSQQGMNGSQSQQSGQSGNQSQQGMNGSQSGMGSQQGNQSGMSNQMGSNGQSQMSNASQSGMSNQMGSNGQSQMSNANQPNGGMNGSQQGNQSGMNGGTQLSSGQTGNGNTSSQTGANGGQSTSDNLGQGMSDATSAVARMIGGQSGNQNGNNSGNQGSQSGNGSQSNGGNGQQGNQNGAGQNDGFGDGQGDNTNSDSPMSGNGAGDGGNTSMRTTPKGMKRVKVTFQGKTVDCNVSNDVVTQVEDRSDNGTKKAIEHTKEGAQRIKTKIQMDENEAGKKFCSQIGSDYMNRNIEFGLKSDVSWQKLLQNVTPRKASKQYTMASPYKGLMNRGITVATQREIGKPKKYTGIKFALDVSGSVSAAELNAYLADITAIFDKYEVEGELIYWSTMVGDAGVFSDKRDALRIKPNSTGGTDVSCVFSYLAGETKVNGQFEPTKVRDIEAVFILTDGCFSMNFTEYKRAFGNKVIWVIDGDPVRFTPPFGKVVGLHRETY